VEALTVYGKAVSILAPTRELPWGTIMSKNLGFFVELMLTPQMLGLDDAIIRQREMLERCGAMFDDGRLQLKVEKVFELGDAREAHRRIASASTTGKLVLEIS
jgi:NADPH2:quinone reductase